MLSAVSVSMMPCGTRVLVFRFLAFLRLYTSPLSLFAWMPSPSSRQTSKIAIACQVIPMFFCGQILLKGSETDQSGWKLVEWSLSTPKSHWCTLREMFQQFVKAVERSLRSPRNCSSYKLSNLLLTLNIFEKCAL